MFFINRKFIFISENNHLLSSEEKKQSVELINTINKYDNDLTFIAWMTKTRIPVLHIHIFQ